MADECILYIFILHDQPQHKHHCQHRILQVTDCINVADECICAITQLLPALYEFNLQVSAIVNIALTRIILTIRVIKLNQHLYHHFLFLAHNSCQCRRQQPRHQHPVNIFLNLILIIIIVIKIIMDRRTM